MAAVRVSVEEHCVLCEVQTFCQAITVMTVPVSVFVASSFPQNHINYMYLYYIFPLL